MAEHPLRERTPGDLGGGPRGAGARGVRAWETAPPSEGLYSDNHDGLPPPGRPASTGIEPGMLVALAYLLGWFGGLLVYLLERHDVEVRFNAAQSMLIDLVLLALAVAFWPVGLLFLGPLAVLSPVGTSVVVGPIFLLAALMLLSVVGGAWVLRIVLAIKGYRLEHVRLPVIGAVAERWALRPT